jgi:hypothetical protein
MEYVRGLYVVTRHSDSNRNVDVGCIYLHRDDCMEGLGENMARTREGGRGLGFQKNKMGRAREERASKASASASWDWTKT